MSNNAPPASPTDGRISAIHAELTRIEESCVYSSQSQFSQAKLWRAANLTLGVLATGLAAVAGGGTLANVLGKTPAALAALAAAAVGAVMTSVNANRRAEQAHISANAYLSLQADARLMRTVDLPGLAFEAARSRLTELSARRDEINKAAEIPFTVAYWLGKLNIRRGATKYEVDKNAP